MLPNLESTTTVSCIFILINCSKTWHLFFCIPTHVIFYLVCTYIKSKLQPKMFFSVYGFSFFIIHFGFLSWYKILIGYYSLKTC